MPDKVKVIKGLGQCTKDDVYECKECPYFKGGCTEDLIADALDLLKKQEKEGTWKQIDDDTNIWS